MFGLNLEGRDLRMRVDPKNGLTVFSEESTFVVILSILVDRSEFSRVYTDAHVRIHKEGYKPCLRQNSEDPSRHSKFHPIPPRGTPIRTGSTIMPRQ